jgi:iron complex outermembrane receptor protein
MRHFKLLPLLIVTAYSQHAAAEHVTLPALSVQTQAAEAVPFALSARPIATADTGDLVKRLAGANINSNGPITSIAQYRGLFADRVNVLIDGVRLHQAGPNRMDAPLNYLPASRLDSVSVYRGIAPVSTGIETIGGTITADSINLGFGHSDEFEFTGKANSGYASNGNARQLGITTAARNKHHRFQVSGSVDRGNDADFDGGEITPSEFERDTFGLNYGLQQNNTTIELDAQHHDTGNTGTPALPMDIIYARGETYKAKASQSLANGATLSGRLSHQDVEHVMNNFRYRSTSAADQRSNKTNVEASGYKFSYAQNSWLVGIEGDVAEHNAYITNPNNAMFFVNNFNNIERDRHSVFVEWQDDIASDWKLETGLRVSNVTTDADKVSFGGMMGMMATNATTLANNFNNADRDQSDTLFDLAAVFTYTVNEEVDLEFGLARKQRAPSYQERYLWLPLQATSGLADGRSYIGNIELDPETAYQLELGLDWHTAKAGFAPRAFYHHINDYIQGTSTTNAVANMLANTMSGSPALQFNNVDAKLYGIDANWYAALSSEWQLDGTISYVRGERRDTDDNLYRIAPLTARTTLSYVQTDWRVGIEAVTVAQQDRVSSENNEKETGGYALFNLSGNYQITPSLLVSAGVNNVFDRRYADHLGGINRVSEVDIAPKQRLIGLGRSAYINMSMNW